MYTYFENVKKGYCPKCGKEITDWRETSIDDDKLDLYFVCDCGVYGCETYELTHHITWANEQ